MRIELLDLESAPEEEVRAWYDVHAAAAKVDLPEDPPPSWRTLLAKWRYGASGDRPQTWLAWDDARERVLGGYSLTLPTRDNSHTGLADVVVHPDARRRGIGRRLVEHASDRVRSAGRRLLIGETVEGSPGPAFAASLKAERALASIRRVHDLDLLDQQHLDELHKEAETHSSGYRLVEWEGAVPDERIADMVVLYERMSDAPVDDLDWQQEHWSPERIRLTERTTAEAGDRLHTVAAEHVATGRLVAFTTVFVRAEHPWWSEQGDTGVLPEHRGRRLGLLVKLAMLRRLDELEPEVRRVITWNAGSNAYMIGINERLGYRILDRWHEWQLDVSDDDGSAA